MSLAILFHFLCAQHVSDISISIFRSLRLCCWITTSVVLFSVRCVLEIWCGWLWVVLVLQAEAQSVFRNSVYGRYVYHLSIGQMSQVYLQQLVINHHQTNKMYRKFSNGLHVVIQHFTNHYLNQIGARCWWRSWLRHCATSRKAASSIPDCVIGIFHWHNPSGRTMALGLTQPLTEMSTRNIFWGGG